MATPKQRLFAVAPVLLAVALLLLAASCHGRELKGNGAAGAAGGVSVDESKTLLGLPVPLVPNLPLTPVTGPLIPGVPPAVRASTANIKKKQSP